MEGINKELQFERVSFCRDIRNRHPKWFGIDVYFYSTRDAESIKTRYFAPTTDLELDEVSEQLRHIICVVTGDCDIYDTIPYTEDWSSFVAQYKNLINKKEYQEKTLYGKIINKGTEDNENFTLGFEEPFLSENKDLVFGDIERLYLGDDYNVSDKPYTAASRDFKTPSGPLVPEGNFKPLESLISGTEIEAQQIMKRQEVSSDTFDDLPF